MSREKLKFKCYQTKKYVILLKQTKKKLGHSFLNKSNTKFLFLAIENTSSVLNYLFTFSFIVVFNYLSILINQEMTNYFYLLYSQLITLKNVELLENLNF